MHSTILWLNLSKEERVVISIQAKFWYRDDESTVQVGHSAIGAGPWFAIPALAQLPRQVVARNFFICLLLGIQRNPTGVK